MARSEESQEGRCFLHSFYFATSQYYQLKIKNNLIFRLYTTCGNTEVVT